MHTCNMCMSQYVFVYEYVYISLFYLEMLVCILINACLYVCCRLRIVFYLYISFPRISKSTHYLKRQRKAGSVSPEACPSTLHPTDLTVDATLGFSHFVLITQSTRVGFPVAQTSLYLVLVADCDSSLRQSVFLLGPQHHGGSQLSTDQQEPNPLLSISEVTNTLLNHQD